MLMEKARIFSNKLSTATGSLSYDKSYWEGDNSSVKNFCHQIDFILDYEGGVDIAKRMLDEMGVDYRKNPVYRSQYIQEDFPTARLYWIMAELSQVLGAMSERVKVTVTVHDTFPPKVTIKDKDSYSNSSLGNQIAAIEAGHFVER